MCREVWRWAGVYELITGGTLRKAKGRTSYTTKGNHRNSFQRKRYKLACAWPELLLRKGTSKTLNSTEFTPGWGNYKPVSREQRWMRSDLWAEGKSHASYADPHLKERVLLQWLKESRNWLCILSETSWISKNKQTNKKLSNVPVVLQKSIQCGLSDFSRDLLSNILVLIHGRFSYHL